MTLDDEDCYCARNHKTASTPSNLASVLPLSHHQSLNVFGSWASSEVPCDPRAS